MKNNEEHSRQHTSESTTPLSMKETVVSRIDAYLRDSDTTFARILHALSPYKGEAYLNSDVKRFLDLTTSLPAAFISSPAIIILATAVKLEDGGSAFFVHERVGPHGNDPIDVVKIRCMHPNSDRGALNYSIAKGVSPWEDPRNTGVGAFMRRYQLEELPQLFQVVSKRLSMLGIRPASVSEIGLLDTHWSRERYERWYEYYKRGPLGLSGLNQVFGVEKDDLKRYHLDVFYCKNANLGLDLYLMWRTLVKVLHLEE